MTALGILWFLGVEPKLRVLLVRGLCGLNISPTPKERATGLSYQLAQMWDRDEEGSYRDVRAISQHQKMESDSFFKRLRCMRTKKWTTMIHNQCFQGLRTRVDFQKHVFLLMAHII